MEKFEQFAIRRPALFGFLLIFLYVLFVTLTYPVHFLFPDVEVAQYPGATPSQAK